MVFEELKDYHEELEHIYNLSFDGILTDPRSKYDRDEEKIRIETQALPILKYRLDGLTKRAYHIKKNQTMCMASKLGISKLVRIGIVKECINLYNDLYETANDYTLQDLCSAKQFHLMNRVTRYGREKYTCYTWVGVTITELSDILAIHKDTLFVAVYLLGLESASKIQMPFSEQIKFELTHLLEYIGARHQHLKLITEDLKRNKDKKDGSVYTECKDKPASGNNNTFTEVVSFTSNVKSNNDNSKAKVGIRVSGEGSPNYVVIDDRYNNRENINIEIVDFLESNYGYMKVLDEYRDMNYRYDSMKSGLKRQFNLSDETAATIADSYFKDKWGWVRV